MTRPRSAALALAGLLALAACGGRREAPAPGGPRSFAYQVLELRDAALAARDLEMAARAYAPDAVVIDAGTATVVLRGRDEIRDAHARFLARCPRARVEVLDRAYGAGGRVVEDVERVHCDGRPPVEGRIRYEIVEGSIVRVLKRRSPPFER